MLSQKQTIFNASMIYYIYIIYTSKIHFKTLSLIIAKYFVDLYYECSLTFIFFKSLYYSDELTLL
jgi:hypothetical protein